MTTNFQTDSSTQMAPTDDQIVEEVMADLAANPPMTTAEEQMEMQRRLAWERDRARIEDFLNNPGKYFSSFWQQYKPVIINLLVIGLAIFAVKVVLGIISFITNLPLLSPLFELIGFSYTAWFIYRYMLKAETRQELGGKIDQIKQVVVGTAKDLKQDAMAATQEIKQTTQEIKQSVMGTAEEVKQGAIAVTEEN